MKSEKYIKLGNYTALLSFFIGTLIFVIYFITSNNTFLFIEYGFILIAGIMNLIVLLLILVKANSETLHRKKLLKTSRKMLLNIPAMFVFIWIMLIISQNMIITFTNNTENELTNINIIGCETKHIDKLEPNESKTVWVGIKGDCSIKIEYYENEQIKSETVVGYATNGMGQKMKHSIDGKDKDIL